MTPELAEHITKLRLTVRMAVLALAHASKKNPLYKNTYKDVAKMAEEIYDFETAEQEKGAAA